ncbi:MAG: hypothetical protein NC833_06915 [Candidatus Omnitrophica bacterium]|nr:hypothetical protein [Candidatus Omnitrophota bacterium]
MKKSALFMTIIVLTSIVFYYNLSFKKMKGGKTKFVPEIKKESFDKKETKIDSQTDKVKKFAFDKREELPQWFNNLYALYNENYQIWRQKVNEKGEGGIISSILNTPQSQITTDKQNSSISISSTYSQLPSTSMTQIGTSSFVKKEKTNFADQSSQTGLISEMIKKEENIPEKDENKEGSSNPEENEDIEVIRKITSSGGIINVTLLVNIKTQISGIIITENIPSNYNISSASPMYNKKTQNTYKWLFYGKSIGNQTIYYQLEGGGEGLIEGSFSTSLGTWLIKGDKKI